MQTPWMVVGVEELKGTKFLVVLLYKHDGHVWERQDVRIFPYKNTQEAFSLVKSVVDENNLRFVEIWTDHSRLWKKLLDETWCSAEIKHTNDIKKHTASYLSIPEVEQALIDFYELDFQKPDKPKEIPIWKIRLSNFLIRLATKLREDDEYGK